MMGGPAKGGSLVACWNFKMSIVGTFLLFHLSSMSLWEIYLTLLLFVTISVSLLFGPCRMSEFTLAGPLRRLLQQTITWYKIMLESKVIYYSSTGTSKTKESQAWLAEVTLIRKLSHSFTLQHSGFCTKWWFVAKGRIPVSS